MQTAPSTLGSRIEWIAVAAITAVGMVLRLWPPGRLGLTHFDEGIYAMAGSWVFARRGLASIDPHLIPYAPPGFPILVGLMYAVFGRSDLAAIGVSQISGTLTIPVIAWLARRTFGPGSGVAAAILAALSGTHIAYSRMALTDASFLLFWLLAIGAGMRFLERPKALGSMSMGLTVGLAQQFKYNGWIVGAVVILAAGLGAAGRPEGRRRELIFRTFGWGLVGVVVASLVVLPWYRFVESHGGYAALLRHQRNYLGGQARWLPSFRSQGAQVMALSGSRWLLAATWVSAASAGFIVRWVDSPRNRPTGREAIIRITLLISGGLVYSTIANSAWWVGLFVIPVILTSRNPSRRIVGVWWVALSILTPSYHPYARLWLPIHAVGWIMLGWLLSTDVEVHWIFSRLAGINLEVERTSSLRKGLVWVWILAVGAIWSNEVVQSSRFARILPGLLDPSDSLRRAAYQIVAILPQDVASLRYYGRPSLTFYLDGRVPLSTQSDRESLFQPGDSRTWALLDQGLDNSGRAFAGRNWGVFDEIPSALSLPTALDIAPEIATGAVGVSDVRFRSLLLYESRSRGAAR